MTSPNLGEAFIKAVQELEDAKKRLSEAEILLSQASNMLDNVHCYDTDLYRKISSFIYGNQD